MPGIMEIEFTPGVWTDVSLYTKPGVKCSFGIGSWDDDGQAGQIVFTLENKDGRFTPDNPLSPYWPNVVEGIRVRWSIERAGTTYRRGWYFVKTWVLNTADIARDSTVTITALDKLASLSRREMNSDIIERYRYTTRANAATWMDAWPLTTTGHPRRPHNVGYGGAGISATLVDPKNGRGASSYADPTPLVLEGSITTAPNTFLGPVVLFPTQATPAAPMRSLTFWVRIPGAEAPLDDFAVIASGWDAGNNLVFRVVVSNTTPGAQQLEIHWNIDPETDIGAGFVLDTAPDDNAWHSFYFQDTTPGTVDTGVFYDSGQGGNVNVALGFALTDVVSVVMGGEMRPDSPGGQNSRSVPMALAGVMASDNVANGIEKYARGDTLTTSSIRFINDYANWGEFTGAYTGTAGVRQVAVTSSIGRTVTDSVQELARTISGLCWVRYTDDVVELIDGQNMRPRPVTLTLTVGADDDVQPGQVWRRGAIENPTRQTVQSPLGDGTFIDVEAELKERRDGSAISAPPTGPAASRALAAWYVRRGKRLRLSQFGLDVTSAVQDLWPFVLTGIRPGVRIRLQNLEPTQFGYTYREVFLIGWEEEWGELEDGEQSCFITLDTVPADVPAETVVEDTPAQFYDRFDFDLQAASIGGISDTATSITITSTGPALVTDPEDYPIYLNLDGETVAATGPPASAVSPQTVTITRGQLGTVARAHSAGTLVQVFPMSGFGAG